MIKPKQERLREVYEHLRQHFGVHTQIDFAKALGLTRPAISAAMNGNEAYLTDNLFKRICAAYQGVFNLDYLLTGNGTLLTIEEEVKAEQVAAPTAIIPPAFDFSIVIEHAVKAATAYADQTIATLKSQLADKDKMLTDKDDIITNLKARIRDLERTIAADRLSNIEKYPFTIGAAEGDKQQPNINNNL